MTKKLYIIHGWTYTIEPWTQTVGILQAQGYEVVQLRVPGLTAPSEKSWTVDEYVSWLREQLQHEEHPIVLGHSNGGRIAMHYDVAYPGHLSKLILLSSAGIEVAQRRISLKRRVFRVAAKLLAPLKHVPFASKVVYRLLGSDYGAAPPHMKVTLANMLASDKLFDASNVTAPTSILWGEADTVTPVSMARALNGSIKGSTMKLLPDWKHAPYITHPTELAEELVQVLEQSS